MQINRFVSELKIIRKTCKNILGQSIYIKEWETVVGHTGGLRLSLFSDFGRFGEQYVVFITADSLLMPGGVELCRVSMLK